MEVVGELGYILSGPELIYLVALTGTQKLLGVRDDTTLLSRDEILERWPGIKRSLQDKRYLEENSDGSINIHKELFRCIDVCAKPDVYLTCSKHCGYFNCYINRGICVTLEQSKHMQDTFILTPAFSHKSVKDLVFDFFVPEGEYASINERFLFTRKEYETIKNTELAHATDIDGNNAAIKALRDESAPYSMTRLRLGDNAINKINVYKVYIGEGVIWRLSEDRSCRYAYMLKSISKERLIADLEEKTNSFRYLFE